MSYGVIASKPAQVLVETESTTRSPTRPPTGSLVGLGEASPTRGLDHFTTLYGARWITGRVTLTSRHLTFVAHDTNLQSKPGERTLELDVSEIDEVVVSGGLVGGRVLTVRAGKRRLRMKVRGAQQLADQVRGAAARGARGGFRTA